MTNSRITQIMKTFKPALVKNNTLESPEKWMKFGANDEYEVSVANDFETRKAAYFLLYKNYTEKEYIQSNAYKLWYTIHDSNKTTFTVVVKKGGKVYGTLTVNFKDRVDLPANELFHDEISQIRKNGKSICEITSLAIDKKAQEAKEILIKLFNYAYIVSKEIRDCSGFIITVNPKHVSFYERKLLFSRFGNTKDYQKVGGAPATFLFLDFEKVNNTINQLRQKETPSKDSHRTLYISFYISKKLIDCIKYNFLSSFRPMNKKEINLFFYDNFDKWQSLNSNDKEIIKEHIYDQTINI